MRDYSALCRGAIDLHCHIDLEFSREHLRKRVDEASWLPLAEELGFAGFVLKSHMWPTAGTVDYIANAYGGPVQLFPSITLNHAVGGLDLFSVDVARQLGARVVYFPTWSSRGDIEGEHGFGAFVGSLFDGLDLGVRKGIAVVDEEGELTAAARRIVDYCVNHDLLIATGHISATESLALVRYAASAGAGRVLVTHPFEAMMGVPQDAVAELLALHAVAEICWATIAPGPPGRLAAQDVVRLVRTFGPEKFVLSSDYFMPSHPPAPELFRQMIGVFAEAGLGDDELITMVSRNPHRLLGLEIPEQHR